MLDADKFHTINDAVPTIAFWNLARKSQLQTIVGLIESYGVEILVVAEQDFASAELILAYARRTGQPLFESVVLPKRVRFYSTFPETLFRSLTDEEFLSIKEYRPLVGRSVLIVGVHFPSKLHRNEVDQTAVANRVARRIEEAENDVGHDRTIALGDFNMNPFETGMTLADGLHSVMDRRIARVGSRIVDGQARRFFYNPMWRAMGNNSSNALGTYFKNLSTKQVNIYWHTFDQALLRPSLLEFFREDDLRLVEVIEGTSLLHPSRPGLKTQISDHLPIVLSLTT